RRHRLLPPPRRMRLLTSRVHPHRVLRVRATTRSRLPRAWASVPPVLVLVTTRSPLRREWASARPLATSRARRLLAPVRPVRALPVPALPVPALLAAVRGLVPVLRSSSALAVPVGLVAVPVLVLPEHVQAVASQVAPVAAAVVAAD